MPAMGLCCCRWARILLLLGILLLLIKELLKGLSWHDIVVVVAGEIGAKETIEKKKKVSGRSKGLGAALLVGGLQWVSGL